MIHHTSARVGAVLSLLFILSVGIANAQDDGSVVATGLNGPMGVLVSADGSVWVIDTGMGGDMDVEMPDLNTHEIVTVKYGETARVIKFGPDGKGKTIAMLPSVVWNPEESIGGGRLAMMDGVVYASSGGWIKGTKADRFENMSSILRISDEGISEVANTWDMEAEMNPDGMLVEAHPFGLTPGADGMLWIADAAANTLLKMDPASGELEMVAAFGGVPSPMPNSNRKGANESDPVPTAVAFDDDGNAYVSFLPGFPFLPGSAKVVKVDADGKVSDFATGLTMLTDLQRGPDGNFYAITFAEFTEQGPTPNSGAVVRVKEGDASEPILSGLSFPTAISFNDAGDAFVTINGVGPPGSGQVVKYAALAAGE